MVEYNVSDQKTKQNKKQKQKTKTEKKNNIIYIRRI